MKYNITPRPPAPVTPLSYKYKYGYTCSVENDIRFAILQQSQHQYIINCFIQVVLQVVQAKRQSVVVLHCRKQRKKQGSFWDQWTTNTTMSIAQNPMTGQMRKSMANFNTFVHKGQNVVSSKAFNRKDSNTDAQQLHRASFKLIADAFQSLGGYGEMGFPVRPERMSPFNQFMALNLPNAIDASGGVPMIDYSKMVIAKGTLPPANDAKATFGTTGVTISCLTNIDFPRAGADDVLIVLGKMKTGALYAARQARGNDASTSVLLPLPNVTANDMEFVYVFAVSADGKKASNSAYVALQ